MAEGEDLESMTTLERKELSVFKQLVWMVPGIDARLMSGSEEDVSEISDLIQKGSNGARADDTKGMKAAIVDWITPKGQSLNPHIPRNVKSGRGFNHERTGALLCPAGLDWFNSDGLLVSAFKHIFTSPSSVDQEPKATRSGNARIHGMRCVTKASIAYITTQARFALNSAQVFSRMDLITDSECFYNSILELLEDPDERDEVEQLMVWWNRQVFPLYTETERLPSKNSALARIRQKREEYQARALRASAATSIVED
ncbi:hypothetical protein PAXINDRAFT_13568 [Paxillus involutus ATCC 200175]|uniref:Uncharacterized protein n=1 Tax=Paxillus involutus ATCC 200175 TaxID=664439 RepID=A0A0C9TDH1_PAXIN|nr:hypothetical protein PAXINDRAFT_13568 [Paxillus involutus ATCC 200175]